MQADRPTRKGAVRDSVADNRSWIGKIVYREIVRRAEPEVTVWDHHLVRDPRFRARTERFWALRQAGYRVETVAELCGTRPLVEESSKET